MCGLGGLQESSTACSDEGWGTGRYRGCVAAAESWPPPPPPLYRTCISPVLPGHPRHLWGQHLQPVGRQAQHPQAGGGQQLGREHGQTGLAQVQVLGWGGAGWGGSRG